MRLNWNLSHDELRMRTADTWLRNAFTPPRRPYTKICTCTIFIVTLWRPVCFFDAFKYILNILNLRFYIYANSGSTEHSVDYEVQRIRDSASSSVRRVLARQNGAVLVAAHMSFCAMKVWVQVEFYYTPKKVKKRYR